MELRTDESQKPSNGLKLAGVDTEEMRKKAQASMEDPWDFSQEMDVHRITSAKSKLEREAKEDKVVTASDILVRVMQVIVYLTVVVEVGVMCYACVQPAGDIVWTLKGLKAVWIVCMGILLLDAILIQMYCKAGIMILLIPVVFPFLYPYVRANQIRQKNGLGTAFSVIFFLGFCGLLGNFLNAYMDYGNAIFVEEQADRLEIMQAFNQTLDSGKKVMDIWKQNFEVKDVSVKDTINGKEVIFTGEGTVYLKDDEFGSSLKKDITTKIHMTKDETGNKYVFSAVELSGDELTEKGIADYIEYLNKY